MLERLFSKLRPALTPAAGLLTLDQAATLIGMEPGALRRLATHSKRHAAPVSGSAADGAPLFDPVPLVRWAMARAIAIAERKALKLTAARARSAVAEVSE